MSALLRKHRATKSDDEDSELTERLMEEMDSMESAPIDDEPEATSTDSRWDALKKIATSSSQEE